MLAECAPSGHPGVSNELKAVLFWFINRNARIITGKIDKTYKISLDRRKSRLIAPSRYHKGYKVNGRWLRPMQPL